MYHHIPTPPNKRLLLVAALTLFSLTLCQWLPAHSASPWKRHTIDSEHRGADGVRLGDFNRDGLSDVVTGWEESGLVKLYLNPGPEKAKEPWPAQTIARMKSPEDAVPFDVDGDGKLDIVSCHEGKQRQVLVHWNDGDKQWRTDHFPQLNGRMWMFALPLPNIGSRRALVVGAKGNDASISLLLATADATTSSDHRALHQWSEIRLRNAGWIMSLVSMDMDSDGDQDIVFSDRKGARRCAAWLEQPPHPKEPWVEHVIAGQDMEVMFLQATNRRSLIATRNQGILDCRYQSARWDVSQISTPPLVPLGKAVRSLPDDTLVWTANTKASRNPEEPGIWQRDASGHWWPIDITSHVKFDRMEALDLDGDGDLDIMTCEERQNLGVVWYENPSQ